MSDGSTEYDRELGAINTKDREYAEDLLGDLAEAHAESEPHRQQIVAEWFRKVRYEAVIEDRKKQKALTS